MRRPLETGLAPSFGAKSCTRLEPVQCRHSDVQHDDVGLQTLDEITGIRSVRRLFDGPPVWFQSGSDETPSWRMVVSNDHRAVRQGPVCVDFQSR